MIDKNKQYRYAGNGSFRRILCTDRAGKFGSVLSETTSGQVISHQADGTSEYGQAYNLVEVDSCEHLKDLTIGIDINKQYKYRNSDSFGQVLCTARANDSFPVVSETDNGLIMLHAKDGTHECDPDYDLVEVGKYDHIKKGDAVVVAVAGFLRVFAGVNKKGKPLTFATTKGDLVVWGDCRLATKEDLE